MCTRPVIGRPPAGKIAGGLVVGVHVSSEDGASIGVIGDGIAVAVAELMGFPVRTGWDFGDMGFDETGREGFGGIVMFESDKSGVFGAVVDGTGTRMEWNFRRRGPGINSPYRVESESLEALAEQLNRRVNS